MFANADHGSPETAQAVSIRIWARPITGGHLRGMPRATGRQHMAELKRLEARLTEGQMEKLDNIEIATGFNHTRSPTSGGSRSPTRTTPSRTSATYVSRR